MLNRGYQNIQSHIIFLHSGTLHHFTLHATENLRIFMMTTTKPYQHIAVSKPNNCPGVAVVALNRPRKRNAINSSMWKEIGHVFSELTYSSDDIRCIALVGNGNAFCAGIDLSDPSFGLVDAGGDSVDNGDDGGNASDDVARKALRFRPKILEMQRAFTALEACPVPVVAIIQGFCIGGGVDLITAADIRICSPGAVFSVREARLGLAADVGTLQRLPKIVGFGSRVRELIFTGEDFGAAEAARIGLVSRIATSDETLFREGLAIAQRIASNSPVAVRGSKLSLNYSRDHTVVDGLEHIATHNAGALITDDLMSSFAGKDGDASRFAPVGPLSRL